MIGYGLNVKSMAYVKNVAAFLQYSLSFGPGVHLYNYVDKPDLSMNELILEVKQILGKPAKVGIRVPYSLGYFGGLLFDVANKFTRQKYAISSIRVKKFCSNTIYNTSILETGFRPPIGITEGIRSTVKHEYL